MYIGYISKVIFKSEKSESPESPKSWFYD